MKRTPLHSTIQKLVLIGAKLDAGAWPTRADPPAALVPLITAIQPFQRESNERALEFGHRYRSGFWTIYLLSAIAVLFAVLPMALGWDEPTHTLHPYAGLWALGEIGVICTVGVIYWLGHRQDWQGQWLAARTQAELAWYLPLIATLVDFTRPNPSDNWYSRVFDTPREVQLTGEISALCVRNETTARNALANAWSDPSFVSQTAAWAGGILESQRHYHLFVALRNHALLHRLHLTNTWLFGMTAFGALGHLVIHSLWLTLVTTFFPALGASLHGALAQSEAYRLTATSQRLVTELERGVNEVKSGLERAVADESTLALREAIQRAVALILDEHEDWHMLVRPHHLPLG